VEVKAQKTAGLDTFYPLNRSRGCCWVDIFYAPGEIDSAEFEKMKSDLSK